MSVAENLFKEAQASEKEKNFEEIHILLLLQLGKSLVSESQDMEWR